MQEDMEVYACFNEYLMLSIYCVKRLIHMKFDNLCIMIASKCLTYIKKVKDEKLVTRYDLHKIIRVTSVDGIRK